MELTTKSEMVAALDKMRADWAAVLGRLEPEQMDQAGALGDWPFRDVISHLTGWRKRTVERFEAAAEGKEPVPPPWPFNEENDDDVEQINNWIHESDLKRPLGEVLDESDVVLRRLDAALRAVPEEDLVTPGRFAWFEGYPLSAYLEGSLEHYYEHKQELQGWLTAQEREGSTN